MQKCSVEPAKKQTALIHELEGSHFDLLTAVTDFLAVDLELVQTTRNVWMEHEIPFGNSNREKQATFSDFPLFSGNFPVGRTDETCSIYRQPEIPEILTKWKAPYISTASYPDASLRAKEDRLCSPLSPSQGSLRFVISRVSRSAFVRKTEKRSE